MSRRRFAWVNLALAAALVVAPTAAVAAPPGSPASAGGAPRLWGAVQDLLAKLWGEARGWVAAGGERAAPAGPEAGAGTMTKDGWTADPNG